MKTKHVTIALVSSALVLGGVCFQLWLGRPDTVKQNLAYYTERNQQVYQQYRAANYAEAKAAVRDHISFLDQSSALAGDPSRKPHDVDAMMWCVRLARLEEATSAGSGEQFMEEALRRCDKFGWVDCSREYLRSQVDRMDQIALAKPGR